METQITTESYERAYKLIGDLPEDWYMENMYKEPIESIRNYAEQSTIILKILSKKNNINVEKIKEYFEAFGYSVSLAYQAEKYKNKSNKDFLKHTTSMRSWHSSFDSVTKKVKLYMSINDERDREVFKKALEVQLKSIALLQGTI